MQFLQTGQSRNVERWSMAAGIFLFGLAAWAYLWISGQFPFYFIWDMDLATVLDIIVMQSGLHPDHVNHPGFGMYLVLDLWIGLAKYLNWISAVDLDALANSMSPLACVAELTDCVRSLSPFIGLGFALFQGLALTFLLRIPAPLALLVFAVFLSQSSFLYHAAMNRTELYAMFFWSMGFCALAVAARNQARRAKALWILAAGVALGLAILTKLQVVLYVVALPFLFAFIQIAQGCRLADFWPGSWGRQDWGYRILAWANCIVFAALMTLAWFVEPPDGVWSFTDRYRPTAYAVLFMFIYMACPAGLTFLRGSRPALFGLLRFLTLLGTGLLGCSLFFFMILPSLALSWQYLLVTYKMTFLRGALFAPKPIAQYMEQLVAYWRYEPLTLVANGLALLLFFVWARHRKHPVLLSLAVVLVSGLVAGCALLSARPILRDWLWWETILNVWTLILLFLPWNTRSRPLQLVSALLLLCLCLGNMRIGLETLPRLDAVYSQYGYHPRPWLSFVYFGAHQKYKRLIRERYGYPDDAAVKEARGPELAQASHHAVIRRTAAFPFPGRSVDLRHVSIAAPGFPVLRNDLALRLTSVPPELAGAVVVDPLAAPAAGPFLSAPPQTDPTEEWAFTPFVPIPDSLAVLPRSDLTVWMFLPSETTDAGPVLEVADTKRTVRYVGQRIEHYENCRIAPGTHPFFVVTGAFLP